MQPRQLGTFSRHLQLARTFPHCSLAGKHLERFRGVEGVPRDDPNDSAHYPIVHRDRRSHIPRRFSSDGATLRYDPGSRRRSATTASCNTRCEGNRECCLLREAERRPHYATQYEAGSRLGHHGIRQDPSLQTKLEPRLQLCALVDEPKWHDETHIRRGILPAFRFYRCRTFRRLECETHFVGWDIA